jgi:hypothetical protein
MIGEATSTVEDFRKRIQALSDDQLIRFGKAARYMADPRNSANGRSVEPVFKIQLRECREDWRRRRSRAHSSASECCSGVWGKERLLPTT